MSKLTPRWKGIVRGFQVVGHLPWRLEIEMPVGPSVYGGDHGPSVHFDQGQEVTVLTAEGLAEVERAAAENAWDDALGSCNDYSDAAPNPYRREGKP